MLEKGGGQDPFAGGREGHIDRVVHAAVHDRFNHAVARTPAEDVRGLGHERGLAGPLVGLLGERTLGPVDRAVETEVGPMQIVRAAGERLPLEPLFTPIRDAVPIGVRQFPDARRRRHIERAVEPHRAFGKHHLVGEHDARVEPAVTVLVLEAHDPVRLVGELFFDSVVRSRGVGDVEPPLLVEVRDDRAVHDRRTGDALDFEPGGNREDLIGDRRLSPRAREHERSEDDRCKPDSEHRGFHR